MITTIKINQNANLIFFLTGLTVPIHVLVCRIFIYISGFENKVFIISLIPSVGGYIKFVILNFSFHPPFCPFDKNEK